MPTWNELFKTDEFVSRLPQPEIYRFISRLESNFNSRPLKIWDVCCGAGRHVALISELGHEAYGSDNAPNALERTGNLLKRKKLKASLKLSDMTECPWDEDLKFHGAISWDAIHHNTIANIQKAVGLIHDKLLEGGYFIGTIKCHSALNRPKGEKIEGKEIEPGTIVQSTGLEAGVPHHYFTEEGIRDLFKNWKIEILVEQRYTYVETIDRYYEKNPFNYSSWGILARKQ